MVAEITDEGLDVAQGDGLLRFTTDEAFVEELSYFTPMKSAHFGEGSYG